MSTRSVIHPHPIIKNSVWFVCVWLILHMPHTQHERSAYSLTLTRSIGIMIYCITPNAYVYVYIDDQWTPNILLFHYYYPHRGNEFRIICFIHQLGINVNHGFFFSLIPWCCCCSFESIFIRSKNVWDANCSLPTCKCGHLYAHDYVWNRLSLFFCYDLSENTCGISVAVIEICIMIRTFTLQFQVVFFGILTKSHFAGMGLFRNLIA